MSWPANLPALPTMTLPLQEPNTTSAKTHVSRSARHRKDAVNYHCTTLDAPAEETRRNTGVPPCAAKASSSSDRLASSKATLRPPLKGNAKPRSKRSRSNDSTSKAVYTLPPSRSTAFLAHTSPNLSSSLADLQPAPPPYSNHDTRTLPMNTDTEDDDDMIYTAQLDRTSRVPRNSSQSLRSRIFGMASSSAHASPVRTRDKPISTTPGALCAGETETETDEPSRHLPTARIVPSSGPIVPPTTLEQRLTPLLFEFARFLSILPAVFGTLYNLYQIYSPPTPEGKLRPPPQRIDFFVSALWAILTGHQCLALATGLLTRWRLYYPPLSTLVRLLALQGICWPATHLTLSMFEHDKRPVITWALIGTTTCMSRSVQLWVTSNLWWERRDASAGAHAHASAGAGGAGASASALAGAGGGVLRARSSLAVGAAGVAGAPVGGAEAAEESRRGYWKRWGGGGKWGGRRWDWREVGVKCVLPAGVVYVVTAWAELLRREWEAGARHC